MFCLADKPIERGVSLVSSVRNRSANLSQALSSWIRNPSVDQIIIVDWGSTPSTAELVKHFNSDKVVHLYVSGQNYYCHTHSLNFGARFASYDKLLFLDADILLQQDFFIRHQLQKGIFYAGNWRLARNENETYLNGQFFVNRADFFAVNGLDERIQSYGWDDSDLYRRLRVSKKILTLNLPAKIFWKLPYIFGLKRKDISPDSLTHLPHADRDRIAEYGNKYLSPASLIQDNMKVALARPPWSKKFNLKEYDFLQVAPGFFEARQIEDNFFAVKPLNGLGNRLRVLASCWAVSEVLGKKLYVCWTESPGFSAESFESLFSVKLDFISEASYRMLENSPNNIVINQRVKADTQYADLESGGYRDLGFWTKGINQGNLLLEWHNSLDHLSRGQIKLHTELKDFDRLFAEKLKLFRPAEQIAAATFNFAEANFKQQKVIGFHLRRGDALQSPWVKEYAVSSDEAFVKAIQNELEQDSTVKFFLATDCQQTFEKVKALYPEQIIFYQKQFVESKFQAPKPNQAEALIEMLLLSKTAKIIGTRWSTFSEMAAKIGDVELEICT